MTKFAGDKTDVTALVSYAQGLEAEIERLRAALEATAKRMKSIGFLEEADRVMERLHQQSTNTETK